MSHDEKLIMCRAMKHYGGSFVNRLSECVLYADEKNAQTLIDAFPEYVRVYGPGSRFFEIKQAEEA